MGINKQQSFCVGILFKFSADGTLLKFSYKGRYLPSSLPPKRNYNLPQIGYKLNFVILHSLN